MPVYEYQCTKCKRIVETLQKVDDPAPECHGKMVRLMSEGSFILKGKGWYATDYKDRKKPSKS